MGVEQTSFVTEQTFFGILYKRRVAKIGDTLTFTSFTDMDPQVGPGGQLRRSVTIFDSNTIVISSNVRRLDEDFDPQRETLEMVQSQNPKVKIGWGRRLSICPSSTNK